MNTSAPSPQWSSSQIEPMATASAPVLNSVSPSSGPTAGGTSVTLSGSGFTGTTTVTFGTHSATSFTFVSDAEVTAVTPAGTGTVKVTITTRNGTSLQNVFYTYGSPPTLTSVAPPSGPLDGGNTVTLSGSGFTGATAVSFGTNPAVSFTIVSDTSISAVAPAGSGSVQITVTGPTGTSNGLTYAYVAAPVVSGLTPAQGPTAGGTTVTITGTGFTGATAVLFGSTPAASFTVVSSTQLTAVTPPGAAGPVAVAVTTPGGTSAGGPAFFYVGLPQLTTVSPDAGPLAGGTTITLTGTHLVEATAVRFGNTPATSFSVVSDVQVSAVAPPGATGMVEVTVTTAGGTSNGVPYSYLPVPSVTAVSPVEGPLSGGNTVTFTGTGLTAATQVLFGTQPAPFTVVSDSHLTATAPAGAAGPVNLTVTSRGGSSQPVAYTRVAAPVI